MTKMAMIMMGLAHGIEGNALLVVYRKVENDQMEEMVTTFKDE